MPRNTKAAHNTLKDVEQVIRVHGVPTTVVLSCGHRFDLPLHEFHRAPLRRKCPTCTPNAYKTPSRNPPA